MFISVDLPAPFSPSSAWTSPALRSKSTWSLATTPGNRLVMPRSSRTVEGSTATAADSREAAGGALLERRGDLDLARDDLLLQLVHLFDEGLRHRRVDLADVHAAVLEVEEQVASAPELVLGDELRGLEDAVVDALDAGGEHALRVVVLVLVDADAPDAGLVRGLERAEPAAAGDLEEHLCALRDLVLGHRLALVRSDEVLGVADQDLDLRVVELRAVLVAGDPDVDRRDLQAADRADDLLAALLLGHLGGEVADEAAGLVRRVGQSHHVPAAVERRARDVVVGDREVDVRVLLRDCVGGVGEQEAGRDDQVGLLADRLRQVRDVVGGRVRLQLGRLDAELGLGPVETLLLRLVEGAVVELADVADERYELVRVLAAARARGRRGAVAAPAAAGREREHRDSAQHVRRFPHDPHAECSTRRRRAPQGPPSSTLVRRPYDSFVGTCSFFLMMFVL